MLLDTRVPVYITFLLIPVMYPWLSTQDCVAYPDKAVFETHVCVAYPVSELEVIYPLGFVEL